MDMPNLFLFKWNFLDNVWGSLGGGVKKKIGYSTPTLYQFTFIVDENKFLYKWLLLLCFLLFLLVIINYVTRDQCEELD